MKKSCISIGTALYLALLVTSFPTSAWAIDNSANVPQQAQAVPEEILDAKAQVSRGIAAYDRGEYQEAFRLLTNASVIGGPEVHYRLGLMYAEGLGVRKNPNRAAYWLRLAAKQNHVSASEALSALKQLGLAT